MTCHRSVFQEDCVVKFRVKSLKVEGFNFRFPIDLCQVLLY